MVKNPFDNNITSKFSDYCYIYQLFNVVILLKLLPKGKVSQENEFLVMLWENPPDHSNGVLVRWQLVHEIQSKTEEMNVMSFNIFNNIEDCHWDLKFRFAQDCTRLDACWF